MTPGRSEMMGTDGISEAREAVGAPPDERSPALVAAWLDSYRRLADVFHDVLAEQSLDSLLERIADTLDELIPYDTLTIYEADNTERRLYPVLARDAYAAEIMGNPGPRFGQGLTGWAVEHREPLLANEAHLDPRVVFVPGTPPDPEALITVPLIARDAVKGALNIYRTGSTSRFSEEELQLAKRFGDAAALALDNAQSRAALEQLAQSDSLTGLYNHRFFHERLRAELVRAGRAGDSTSVLMLDIDDFKRLNDIHGHGLGDQVLVGLADLLRNSVRGSDVVCRLGGEELAVIMPSSRIPDAAGLAERLRSELEQTDFGVGRVSVSMGIANGPEHAANPRELAWCAEAAMMTAKAQGKDRVVVYQPDVLERPTERDLSDTRDVRSIAHLKMLQSLAGKLNRLNNVHDIAMTIATELRTLIDYHNCRVYVAEDRQLVPVALMGAYEEEDPEGLRCEFGEGITGRAAANNESLLISNALECDFGVHIPNTEDVPESIVAVPLSYGNRVIGVIVLSSVGVDQFDEDDVRLMEVLAGNASVALENARLYEAQRREAQTARSLLEFSDGMANASSLAAVAHQTTEMSARMLLARQCTLWLQDDSEGEFHCVGHADIEAPAAPMKLGPVDRATGEAFIAGRGEPFVLSEGSLPEGSGFAGADAGGTVVVAPLSSVAGWICVRRGPEEQVSGDALRLIAGISYQASVAIQKVKLYAEQRESFEIAHALLGFGRELSAAGGVGVVIQRVAEQSARILGSERTAVWLQEPETGDVVAEGWCGYDDPGLIAGVRVPADVALEYLKLGRPFVMRPEVLASVLTRLEGVSDATRDLVYAFAPFVLDGGRIGAVMAASRVDGDVLSAGRIRLLDGIAQQAKLAIGSAWNFETLEQTFMSTVEALANALDSGDGFASSHARDITEMALKVGKELELDPPALRRLRLGALFHDIGRIGIPPQVLLKPGPLNEEELSIVRNYPELGDRILAPIARLEDVRPVVRACHERFDGLGYPEGLSGDAIPMQARIICVCDAYHAMTSDKPYRRALTRDEARLRLTRAAGTQFDPVVVNAFLRVLDREG